MTKPDTDAWGTPQPVYDYFNDRLNFAMDIAASKENAKHENFLTKENSAFDFNFSEMKGRWLWCNPPYSNVMPWVNLAIRNRLDGIGTVLLFKHDCSTKWYKRIVGYADVIAEVIGGRLPFQHYETGELKGGNNFPSAIAIFHHDKKTHGQRYINGGAKRDYLERNSLMSYKKGANKL